ncbi:MAG TPA: DUF1684 domain-containing protein [Bryobacteraceae bacterium]|jgi:uncharacterized protein|nr:DUF1684 domain-containing protein [Bryobacteraceae bacterium]
MRAFAALLIMSSMLPASDHLSEVEAWRSKRLATLQADDGWLTVAGLYWLKPGLNRFAELPAGLEWTLHGKRVSLRQNGAERELKPDNPGPADLVKSGTLTMFIIERGGKYGVRVRDTNSPYRKSFKGVEHYPVDAKWKVAARWHAYAQPKKRVLPTVIEGVTEEYDAPGEVEFKLAGKTLKLEPVLSGGRLFFVFRDLTTGKTTYPAGRFLYADLAKDGVVTLDFNQAYNPPCAFTPYATCPLPLPQNRLPIALETGEKNYRLH